MRATAKFTGGMSFEARIRDHVLKLDTVSPLGKDSGPSPKALLLPAILGCTGMDVVAFLKKHKVEFDSLDLSADAEVVETHPKIFQSVEVIFDVKGPRVDEAQVIRAVEESMTKYCGVSAMISKASPIFYTVRINDEIAIRGQARF